MTVTLRDDGPGKGMAWNAKGRGTSRVAPEAKAGIRLRRGCLDGCYRNRRQTDDTKGRKARDRSVSESWSSLHAEVRECPRVSKDRGGAGDESNRTSVLDNSAL